MTDIGPLRVRRGATDDFDGFTPVDSEPVKDSTTKELYVGDGSTERGHPAMGTENRRRLLSLPYAVHQRPPIVTKLFDVSWWGDPDAISGSGFSEKQGYSLTPGLVNTVWECVARGLVPAGSFTAGSWIEVHCTAFVHAYDGSQNLVAIPGLVWDFDDTQIINVAHGGGDYAVQVRHDTGGGGTEDQWLLNEVAVWEFRIRSMGRNAHLVSVEKARLYGTGAAAGNAPKWTSVHEGRTYYNTLDMSIDHMLFAAFKWNGTGIDTELNDIRVRSASAYMYGHTGGVQPDLTGLVS